MTDQGSLPDDLAGMARRLEAERPVPTGVELERVRHRATVGTAGSQTNRKVGQPMRPRLAILTMLAVGILFMGAGTGLAVSGLSGNDDASEAEYSTTTTTQSIPTTSTPVQGAVAGGAGGGTGGLQEARQPEAQEVAQVAASGDGDSLPFTGFAAIPVIVVGVGMLVGGLVLRRRTTQ